MEKNPNDVKKLKGIEPFNEFFFISCYYHQLITGVKYFGGRTDEIISRYFPAYEFREDEKIPRVRELKAEYGKELEKATGVHIVRKKTSKAVIYELRQAVRHGQPCLVAVDCFELSYREDTYQKKHALHFLLIYGYDIKAQEFFVIDHLFTNSPRYVECKITFSELERGFYALNGQWLGFRLQKLKRIQGIPVAGSPFPECCIVWKEEIKDSMTACHNILAYFKACMSEREGCCQHIDQFIEYFGYVRSKKLTQKYQLRYLGYDDISEKIDRILNNYIFIYGIAMRIKTTGNYRSEDIEKLCQKCELVEKIEREVHQFYLGE